MFTLQEISGNLYMRGRVKGRDVRKALGLRADQWDEAQSTVDAINTSIRLGFFQLTPEMMDEHATLNDAFDYYVKHKLRGTISQGDRAYHNRLRAEIGHVRMDEICNDLVQEIVVAAREADGYKDGSIKRELAVLSACLNFYWRAGKISQQIWIKKPSVDDARVVWISKEQIEGFLEACDEEFRPVAAVLFYMGLRVGEAVSARKEDVWHGNLHNVKCYKGADKKERIRTVPLARAEDYLDLSGSGRLLTHQDGRGWSRYEVYKRFVAVRDMLGLPKELTPHGARHTYASHLIMSGVDDVTACELLGHRDTNTLKRYAHLSTKHLSNALRGVF